MSPFPKSPLCARPLLGHCIYTVSKFLPNTLQENVVVPISTDEKVEAAAAALSRFSRVRLCATP